jgi:hypothetical protein
MRWLIRLLLFWAITGPLFYLFGLPYLLELLSKKAQAQSYSQCEEQLAKEGLVGQPDSPMTKERSEKYCHCVSDGLILTKNDVFDLMQQKPPAGLTSRGQAQADRCNNELQNELATPAHAVTPPDGLIHL